MVCFAFLKYSNRVICCDLTAVVRPIYPTARVASRSMGSAPNPRSGARTHLALKLSERVPRQHKFSWVSRMNLFSGQRRCFNGKVTLYDVTGTASPYFRERLQFPAGRLGNIRIVNDGNGIVFFHLLFYETEGMTHDKQRKLWMCRRRKKHP